MTLCNKYDKWHATALKKNCCKQIPGTVTANIICSIFIDIHGGMLLLVTKTGHTKYIDPISTNGLTPSAAKESLTLRGSSLKCGYFSSVSLNVEPSLGIRRMSSSLLFCAW